MLCSCPKNIDSDKLDMLFFCSIITVLSNIDRYITSPVPFICCLLCLLRRETPMVRKRMGLLEGYPSRRDILRGMAGLLLAVES